MNSDHYYSFWSLLLVMQERMWNVSKQVYGNSALVQHLVSYGNMDPTIDEKQTNDKNYLD